MSIIPSNLPSAPPVDYSSRDYNSILSDLISLIPSYLPPWTDRSVPSFGMTLLELHAYVGDILNYYIDRIANEAFLPTAQQMQSILNIAALLDYTPTSTVAAVVTLQFTIPNPSPQPVTVPAGTQISTATSSASATILFETDEDIIIWGDNSTPEVQTQTGNGQPNQVITLPGAFGGPGTEEILISGTEWFYRSTLSGQTSNAQVYTIQANQIFFGDGNSGGIPPLGAVIDVTYFPHAGPQYQGTVTATQGKTVSNESDGISTGRANQSFTLVSSPVINDSVQVFVDEGSGPVQWVPVDRLSDAYATSTAYTTSVNQNGVVTVQFGDGTNGRPPISGATMTATYRVGGGALGNVAAGALTVMQSTVTGVGSVINTTPASGGADAETANHIRSHAPAAFAAQDRCVAPQDYAALATKNPTIAKASAQAPYLTSISIYVHPVGGFISDPAVLTARVLASATQLTNANGTGYLDTRKMATTSITVLPPQYYNTITSVISTGYVPVDITMEVNVLGQFFQSSVQSQVAAAIAALLSFDAVDFGSRLTLSSVYHAAQMVSGVDYVNVQFMCRGEITPQVLGDVQTAAYEIPILGTLTVGATGGITS